MNIKESNIKTIVKWFNKKKYAEFALPDRHFGRPNDWSYSLEKAYLDSEELIIKLDTNKEFIFSGEVTVQENDNKLEISGFSHLIFTRQDFSTGEIHLEEYFEGKVIFIPDPYAKMRSSWK